MMTPDGAPHYWTRPICALRWIDDHFLRHRYVEVCMWIGERERDFRTCEVEGCQNTGYPCFYPDAPYGHGPDMNYCPEHMRHSGFCSGCGLFWGGVESFEFDPHNLCDNCRYDPEITGDWSEYDADDYEDEYERSGLLS